MKQKSLSIWSALALLIVTSACQKSSPTRPTEVAAPAKTESVTDATTGVTLTSPQLLTPTLNQQFKNVEQPVTLTIRNAVTTGTTALTYTFEVATDAGFASKVYTKDGVSAGANNQTALKIDKIGPARTYFWRARAVSGDLAGPYTAPGSFAIGPEVILQQPVLGDPQPNATVGDQPTLNVTAVARSGPNGPIIYRFEIAESASFTPLVYAATVPERADLGGFTPHTVTLKLAKNTYFWRVQASDPENAVTSPFSATGQFKVEPFSLAQAAILNNPQDLASWAETATITAIEFTSNAILVDFDKRTGPGRWPESGFGTGGIQYTLGMCLFINRQWYCSAAIQFWDGRELEASGLPSHIAIDWFYDARWGPMQGYQPSQGETVGIFVAQGNLRDTGKTSVKERSNVVLMPFGGSYRAR
jgi:hypothetical protein